MNERMNKRYRQTGLSDIVVLGVYNSATVVGVVHEENGKVVDNLISK